MTVKVLYLYPPNYRRIVEEFGVRGKSVIYAHGDTIYNPSKVDIPPQLIRHEQVHLVRQGGDPETWWNKYLTDPLFRLAEEIPAHAAEYQASLSHYRERALEEIATKLASPLYGSLISVPNAREAILREAV